MDLTQFLLKQAEIIQKQLQGLLEKTEEAKQENAAVFSASTDLQGISDIGIGLPSDLPLRTRILFARLHPYFEAGVLFQKQNEDWHPQEAFQRGFCFELTAKEKLLAFEFPEMSLVEVKVARSQSVIHDLGLEEYLNNNKITALAFNPHPDFLFLILSELADPWLKTQVETVQNQVLQLLVDYEA